MISLCAIASPLENRYIDEWIQWHLYVCDFDHIILYLNDWPEIDFGRFDYYNRGTKEVTIIPTYGPRQQIPAYNQCLRQFGRMSDWIGFLDVDEFLYIKNGNVENLVEQYKNVPILAVNWRLFGSSSQQAYEDRPVVDRFTRSQAGVNQHVKILVNCNRIPTIDGLYWQIPHCLNHPAFDSSLNPVIGPYNPDGPDDVCYVAHYVTKSKEECYERRSYRRADCGTPRDDIEGFFDEHDRNDIENLDLIEKKSSVQ